MNIAEIRRHIDDHLSPAALEYWNGCDESTINEMIILSQRDGVEAAVRELEESALPSSQSE